MSAQPLFEILLLACKFTFAFSVIARQHSQNWVTLPVTLTRLSGKGKNRQLANIWGRVFPLGEVLYILYGSAVKHCVRVNWENCSKIFAKLKRTRWLKTISNDAELVAGRYSLWFLKWLFFSAIIKILLCDYPTAFSSRISRVKASKILLMNSTFSTFNEGITSEVTVEIHTFLEKFPQNAIQKTLLSLLQGLL